MSWYTNEDIKFLDSEVKKINPKASVRPKRFNSITIELTFKGSRIEFYRAYNKTYKLSDDIKWILDLVKTIGGNHE